MSKKSHMEVSQNSGPQILCSPANIRKIMNHSGFAINAGINAALMTLPKRAGKRLPF